MEAKVNTSVYINQTNLLLESSVGNADVIWSRARGTSNAATTISNKMYPEMFCKLAAPHFPVYLLDWKYGSIWNWINYRQLHLFQAENRFTNLLYTNIRR